MGNGPLRFRLYNSATRMGFNGPPDPLGTKAFEHAVDMVNGMANRPELIIVTGDLVDDSEKPDEQAARIRETPAG